MPWIGSTYHNPALPAEPADVRALPEATFRTYRAGIITIVTSSATSDDTRRAALEQLLRADRYFWPCHVANNLPVVASRRSEG